MKKLFIALATLVAFSATSSFATTEAPSTGTDQVKAADAKAPTHAKVAKVGKKHVAHTKHQAKPAA